MIRLSLRLPRRARSVLRGAPPRNDRGVHLHPELHWLIGLDRASGVRIANASVDTARAGLLYGTRLVEGPPAPCAVQPLEVAGRPARRYGPPRPGAPLLVFFHGGGWVCGDLRSHDRFCRRLSVEGGWQVIAVDYRRAPEFPFPAAFDDALAAVRELRDRRAAFDADPDHLAVAGDSAGGNLAAAVCVALRDGGEPLPSLQVLVYPSLDLRCTAPSHRLFREGFLLGEAEIAWFTHHYAAPTLDVRASPGLVEDVAGLPPAVVATAGFDPLRDEAEAFVARLHAAGVRVQHLDEADLVHGYIAMDGALRAADLAVARLVAATRDARSWG